MKNQHILCVGPDAWHHTDAGRTLEIMRHLAGPNRILCVDSYRAGVLEHASRTLSPREQFRELFGLLFTADYLSAALSFGTDVSEGTDEKRQRPASNAAIGDDHTT